MATSLSHDEVKTGLEKRRDSCTRDTVPSVLSLELMCEIIFWLLCEEGVLHERGLWGRLSVNRRGCTTRREGHCSSAPWRLRGAGRRPTTPATMRSAGSWGWSDGRPAYEVDTWIRGRHIELNIYADGVRRDRRDEMELDELPEPVRQAVRRHVGSRRLENIDKVTTVKGVTYDVDVEERGRDIEYLFAEDGSLLRRHDD